MGHKRMRHTALKNLLLLSLFVGTVSLLFTARSIAQHDPPSYGAAILRHFVVYEAPGQYCAWPSVVRAANNDLLVLFTQTEEHLGPDGVILSVRSTDNGTTWLTPDTVMSTPIDDRESGVTLLHDGTLIAHVWSTFHTRTGYDALPALSYGQSLLERWSRHVDTEDYRAHAATQGPWRVVSRDHGNTWSPPRRGKDAIHGGVQLHDGTLLLASYRQDQRHIGVYGAGTPEDEYSLLALIRSPSPDSLRFGEPHILQLASGRVIMMIRATAIPYDDRDPRCVLWETYSDDNGKSWVLPFPTELWGFPPHLLQLSDGRILCTYGYRRAPFGERACVSEDGVTWKGSDVIILRSDAPNGDLGYPASVELEPGKILTVYYQPPVPAGTVQQMSPPDPARRKPAIQGTVWTLPPDTAGNVYPMGTRRELFVDRTLIERLTGGSLLLHHPEHVGVAVRFDRPWEGPFSGYATVIKDGSLFRMYYRGLSGVRDKGGARAVTCYAESQDGLTWRKPHLGLFPSHGTAATNIVLADEPVYSHNFSPYLDARPGVPPGERYKGVGGDEKTGLVGFVSADGIHWRKIRSEPLITDGKFDSQNVVYWWQPESTYVCLLRTWTGEGYTGFRTISRSTSRDFLTWTSPAVMEFGGTPAEHLYTNGTQPYFRAPHIAVGLAKRFFPHRAALPPSIAKTLVADSGYGVASSDAVLLTTRGGYSYDRTFMEAFLRPGDTPQDWVSRDNTPALGIVPYTEREMLLYRGSHYAQPSAHIATYRLRLDGFASVHAPYRGCELVTKPISFSGTRLEVNLATSAAGGLRVEIQDPGGKAIPGFALEDAVEVMGDGISLLVSWTSGLDLRQLAGRPVRLRFVLRDADLYAFQFVSEPQE